MVRNFTGHSYYMWKQAGGMCEVKINYQDTVKPQWNLLLSIKKSRVRDKVLSSDPSLVFLNIM